MNGKFSFLRSASFIWQLFVRALRSALFGVVAGALIGAFNGVWCGAIVGIFDRSASTLIGRLYGLLWGAFGGAVVASAVGAVSGSIAFFFVPIIAWRKDINEFLFCPVVAKKSSLGTLVGGLVMAVNFSLYAWLLTDKFTFERTMLGYYYGVVGGFIIGFFWGAIQGALHEVRQQRNKLGANA